MMDILRLFGTRDTFASHALCDLNILEDLGVLKFWLFRKKSEKAQSKPVDFAENVSQKRSENTQSVAEELSTNDFDRIFD